MKIRLAIVAGAVALSMFVTPPAGAAPTKFDQSVDTLYTSVILLASPIHAINAPSTLAEARYNRAVFLKQYHSLITAEPYAPTPGLHAEKPLVSITLQYVGILQRPDHNSSAARSALARLQGPFNAVYLSIARSTALSKYFEVMNVASDIALTAVTLATYKSTETASQHVPAALAAIDKTTKPISMWRVTPVGASWALLYRGTRACFTIPKVLPQDFTVTYGAC
jgi:hypothetical protein